MFDETQKSERVGNLEHENAHAIVTRVAGIPMTQPIPAIIYIHPAGNEKEAFDCETSRGATTGH